jgi:flagellar FliJ protein
MQSLTLLLEREESERDAALAALNDARRQAEGARVQAAQLLTYRADYEGRWSKQFARQGAIEIVQCYHAFTQRLEQAIVQQQRVAEHALAQLEHARALLQACELRVASVRKLIERRVRDVALVGERRDQRSTDEQALRAVVAGGRAIDANGVFA